MLTKFIYHLSFNKTASVLSYFRGLASKALTAFLLHLLQYLEHVWCKPSSSRSGAVLHYTVEPLRIHRNHLDLAMTFSGYNVSFWRRKSKFGQAPNSSSKEYESQIHTQEPSDFLNSHEDVVSVLKAMCHILTTVV